jgi:hypothetical protein
MTTDAGTTRLNKPSDARSTNAGFAACDLVAIVRYGVIAVCCVTLIPEKAFRSFRCLARQHATCHGLGRELLLDKRHSGVLTLLLVIAIAAWLRLPNLVDEGIWFDEAASWEQARGTLAELIAKTANDNYPPLHNLILYAVMNATGSDSEWALRLPSALLGLANIVAIYWLGTLVAGRPAGVFAAALLAASGFHIYYSVEARMYTLLALAATLYAASGFFYAKSPGILRAALVAVCGTALVYSHPFGALNWIAIGIGISGYILWTSELPRRALLMWAVTNAAIAVAFLPWALILVGRVPVVIAYAWIPYPSVSYVHSQLALLYGPPLVAVAFLVGAAIALRYHSRAAAVLLIWLVGPIAAALVISLVGTPILWGRYLIGGLPALAALGGLGMAHLVSPGNALAKLAASFHASYGSGLIKIAAAVLLAIATIGNLSTTLWKRPDWRGIAAYLDDRLQSSDCVLLYQPFNLTVLRYYLRRPFCIISPSSGALDPQAKEVDRLLSAIDAHATKADRIFAVMWSIPDSEMEVVRALRGRLAAFGPEAESRTTGHYDIVLYTRQR